MHRCSDLIQKIRTTAVAVLMTAFVAPSLHAQYDSNQVAMYSRVPLQDFGSPHTKAMDVWGYVSPSGREYAIVCLIRGTGVVEVTDPLNPQVITVVPHSQGTQDVKVFGDIVLAGDDGAALQIIDLSDVDQGVAPLVGEYDWSTHNIAVNETSGYAYLCSDYYPTGGWMDVLDMSDPSAPARVATWRAGVHDAQAVTYESGPYAGREFVFSCSGTEGFDVIDVTDKSNMYVVGSTIYPDMDYCHQGWLSADRRYFYIGDELDELNGRVSQTRTVIIDVSDLSNPTYVGEFTNGTVVTDHNLYWHDGYIYESNNESGLRIFDAGDPLSPTEVGFFDTYPNGQSVGYHGSWSVYPFLPSGTILVSDRESGLFLLDGSEAIGERLNLETTPLIGGQTATLTVHSATPGAVLYFAYSLRGTEWTVIPQLGVRLQLTDPSLAGDATADNTGNASLTRRVPAAGSGHTVWIQAAESGRVSNVLERMIQ